jgi:hypothetical protein
MLGKMGQSRAPERTDVRDVSRVAYSRILG